MYSLIREEIETGDIGIESNNNFIAFAIKRVTKSKASHAYIFIWLKDELFISEYLEGKGHKITQSKKRLKEGNLIAIKRNTNLKESIKWEVATQNFGGEYDMKENILILLKLKLSRFCRFFGIKLEVFDNPFKHNCSRYASLVNNLDRTRFWSPDDLLKSDLEEIEILK